MGLWREEVNRVHGWIGLPLVFDLLDVRNVLIENVIFLDCAIEESFCGFVDDEDFPLHPRVG